MAKIDRREASRGLCEFAEGVAVGQQKTFDLSTLDGLRAWRHWVIDHQRKLNCGGGCPIGSLGSELAETDPEADTVALALLAALQGGLLLTQIERDTKPLEAALDAMLELVTRLGGRS